MAEFSDSPADNDLHDDGITRRDFIRKTSAAAAFTIVSPHVLGGRNHIPPSDKITVALVGAGTQGLRQLMQHITRPELQFVSVCDPNKNSDDYVEWSKYELRNKIRSFTNNYNWGEGDRGGRAGREVGKYIIDEYYASLNDGKKYDSCTLYEDYRQMLEEESDLDSVYIMTPDHHHASVALEAMKKGKHAIMHKPLATTVEEVDYVAKIAAETGTATHLFCDEDQHTTPLLCEWIWDGAIGNVREVHNWSTRPFWPQGMAQYPSDTPPVPNGLNWDLWLGTASDRAYHPDYTHAKFRGWVDFGSGALGDMGHYSFRQIFQILKLDIPVKIEASHHKVWTIDDYYWTEIDNIIAYPKASTIRFEFGERKNMPEVTLNWYDGSLRPPLPEELEIEGRRMPREGLIFAGDKGKILADFTGGSPRIIPESKMKEYNRPEKTLERPIDGIEQWINACRGEKPSTARFEDVAKLSKTVCLGNIALKFDTKLEWDNSEGEFTNESDANDFLNREIRQGWEY
jgi:predicted dehydrogenase